VYNTDVVLLRVLLAIPPGGLRRRLEHVLRDEGSEPVVLTARQTLWARLTHEDYDLVILGAASLRESPDGLVSSIRSLPEHPEIIVLRPREDAEERARLLTAGCLAVLPQDLPEEVFDRTIRALVDRRRQAARQQLPGRRPQDRDRLSDFVSTSPAMQHFMHVARRILPTHSTLLVLGETGVGKERLARAIHAEGPRANGPFIAVNCGALPETLLESELFGHEEGAFTGATRSRKGYFELAHQGTIFLDEIGEMATHLQVRLLRVLEQNRLLRVGGERPVRIDVRVIAATNRDLEAEIKAGRFRLDLYYRLAVVTLTVPPLRERQEDIPELVASYLKQFSTGLRKPVPSVTPAAMEALVSYRWPGNVRELINVIERAVLLCQQPAIDLSDLSPAVAGAGTADRRAAAGAGRPALDVRTDRPFTLARREILDRFEREYLSALLEASRGRVGEAARRAGLNERSLYALMKRNRLRKEAFKGASP
jgi:DNA-binding NtrC family response regulator